MAPFARHYMKKTIKAGREDWSGCFDRPDWTDHQDDPIYLSITDRAKGPNHTRLGQSATPPQIMRVSCLLSVGQLHIP